MQRSIQRPATEKYLVIALMAGLAALLTTGLIWQLGVGSTPAVESRLASSDVPLQIDKNQADTIAASYAQGRVLENRLIRDNGVISYLVTVDPAQDNGDVNARRVVFVDPVKKVVTREERWNVAAPQSALVTKQQAETTALQQTGAASQAMSSELQNYEGREVWQVLVDMDALPSRLVTVDAATNEVLRIFEVLREF